MTHYIEDNNKTAKAFIDSEDGELFISVLVKETNEQYDFGLDEKELETIKFLIEHGKQKR
jgi:hypothetical protein